ncbi:MAG: cellulose synthase/poly-beta-1,6-N-acetylglucosamine synthase-like glycosyltransferase [Phycisphaerales bacterium]|jgi:cellulose synthase/poly-beta-1,6-N-acetylglucosamine synthase-like glycosyltransferase
MIRQMLLILEILLGVIGAVLVVPAAVFCLENVLALVAGGTEAPDSTDSAEPPKRSSLAVLIPAHNEQGGIAATVASVKAQLRQGDRVLVVADNCKDYTAAAAREAGAQVTERRHDTDRGKGFALAHGLRELGHQEQGTESPEIVVFVDADCELEPGCLDALADQVTRTGTAAQAVYVLGLPDGGQGRDSGVRDRVSAFAVRVKNETRPVGLSVLGGLLGGGGGGGGPCLITGSGFAVPWELADPELFSRGDIVEDMTIGLELAVRGYPPRVCRGARVNSALPSDDAAKRTQRERWEHGHLDTLVRKGLPMLGRGVFSARPALVLLGLELCVPPLSLLVMVTVAFATVAGVLAVFGFGVWPIVLGALALSLVLVGTLVAWWQVGREILPARELPAVAWYAACKGPIYVGAIVRRQTGWVRTARDGEKPAADE